MIDLTVPQMRVLLRAAEQVMSEQEALTARILWGRRDIHTLENGMAALSSAVELDQRLTKAARSQGKIK